MAKKKPEQLESREDTINRGKSNDCRITMAEDALKRQRARLDCLENGHKWEYGMKHNNIVADRYYPMSGGVIGPYVCASKHSMGYHEEAVRTCTVCGKTEKIRLPDKLLGKIKKLFK